MTIAPDLHTMTGAYAAHALDPDEATAFERHLVQCEACALEVREFRDTLARLGAAEIATAPPEVKVRVMTRIDTVRQLPPHVQPTPKGELRGTGHRRRWLTAAAAACLAAAVAGGGVAVYEHQRADDARARAAQAEARRTDLVALLTAPDARTATGSDAGGTATVVWSPGRGQAAFVAADLPALAQGRTYQVWFDDAGTMRAAGLLPASDGSLLLKGHIDGASGVGVTVEPVGGSPHPTTQPVILLPFA